MDVLQSTSIGKTGVFSAREIYNTICKYVIDSKGFKGGKETNMKRTLFN